MHGLTKAREVVRFEVHDQSPTSALQHTGDLGEAGVGIQGVAQNQQRQDGIDRFVSCWNCFQPSRPKLDIVQALSLGALLIAALALPAFPSPAVAGEPTDLLRSTVEMVITILQEASLKGEEKKEERRAALRKTILDDFAMERDDTSFPEPTRSPHPPIKH